ncbi:major facilitator superfamily domain-containing protein [Aspergillus fumigatus]
MSLGAEPAYSKGRDEELIETVQSAPYQGHTQHSETKKDDALQLIEQVGHSTVLTAENNARVLRRIDLRLLPVLLGIYFLQQLDKSTLSYASVFGLIEKAHLHGKQYSWLGSVVYVAQLVAQPLIAYILVKVPLGKFLAATTLLWGVSLTCMTAANTFPGLLVCRMFLGLFEAGVAPAFIAVTQMWYRRLEQPVRLGSWYAMNGVVFMFGSLITWGLGHIASSVFEPYQIIFLFFGLITVAFSLVVLIYMPDSPIRAKFLNEEDKLIAIERLRMNQQGIETHQWKWDHVKEACLDLKSWAWFALMFSISIPSGGISTFGPLIVKAFGFDQFKTILFNIPFGAVQLVATMGGAWLATVIKMKGPIVILLCLPPIAGCVMLLQIAHDAEHRGALLAGYYILSVYPGITPMIYSWSAANTAGETKKKVTTGMLIVGQCVGNIIGPTLYTTAEAPLYRRGLLSNLAMFCVLVLLCIINLVYLWFLNKKHAQKRVSMGKNATIVDHSMYAVGDGPADKEGVPVQQTATEDNAFKDLTDWQNEDFVYVKCDGKRPCTRCNKLKKRCVFFHIPKDPATERLENVEAESCSDSDARGLVTERQAPHRAILPSGGQGPDCHMSPASQMILGPTVVPQLPEGSCVDAPAGDQPGVHGLAASPGEVSTHSRMQTVITEAGSVTKRKRSGFEIRDEPVADFISKGLMTPDHAISCFNTTSVSSSWFADTYCHKQDRYIPIFDPEYDTFDSVRSRSSILLNAICTIGSRIEPRFGPQISDILHAELKKWINVIIQNKRLNCLESVQALLVVACYSAERSLILSFATRMALDLGLDEAFEELTQRMSMEEVDELHGASGPPEEECSLMRKSRTWFGLLVLEHIFRVDGGKPPGIRLLGNSRRCRILLKHPSSTVLDLRLFSQVESINDTLSGKETLIRSDIAGFVQEVKVELDLWFDDWLRIIEDSIPAEAEKPFLLLALRVQKCWAEMMLYCKALRSMGVENVAAMSPSERNILVMAKASARKHLVLISSEPDFYLAKLKYAMDFVWAKCAFCFLLLLKLSRLLPERKEEHQELLEHGNRLLSELTKSADSHGNTNGSSKIYLQILKLSIEKYGRAVQESGMDVDQAAMVPFWELFDAQADLQSFVPEQFVTEWDFPGLNLFYFPTAWQDFFGDFSLAI